MSTAPQGSAPQGSEERTGDAPAAMLERRDGGTLIRLTGAWVIAKGSGLARPLAGLSPGDGPVTVDLSGVAVIDTAGCWLVLEAGRRWQAAGATIGYQGLDADQQGLFDQVRGIELPPAPARVRRRPALDFVARRGESAIAAGQSAVRLIAFFGLVLVSLAHLVRRPWRLRLTATVYHVERIGIDAIPIVCLLSFLIGVVMAYQGAEQLRRFGAEIFVVNLVGISVLREIGVLMTAIIIAGRSGSAFTAQIGTMKVNQEVDALSAMGLDGINMLVLPRMIGLVIALPLLVFIADIVGIFGGAVMANLLLDIDYGTFVRQLRLAVPASHFWIGFVKAPVFAFVIALIGCYEGLQVSGSAESVGQLTTKAVVEAIFLVIVLDAVFSVLFSLMGV